MLVVLCGSSFPNPMGEPDACAIGRTSNQILARNNIATEDIEKNLAFSSLTVNELGMQIQAKSLDAVIFWDAIAQYYSEYGDEVPIAPEKNVVSTIDIGVLKFTKHRELTEKFVDFISSEQDQNVFKKHNHRTEAPE
ncbi:MAG: substrate-binding domain-containing protein [Sedimentisphaerales bacterium]